MALAGLPTGPVEPPRKTQNPSSAWSTGDGVAPFFGPLGIEGHRAYLAKHGRSLEVWINGENVTRWCRSANDLVGCVEILWEERHRVPGAEHIEAAYHGYPYITLCGDVAIVEGCVDVWGHVWTTMHGAKSGKGLAPDTHRSRRVCAKCMKQEEIE